MDLPCPSVTLFKGHRIAAADVVGDDGQVRGGGDDRRILLGGPGEEKDVGPFFAHNR